MAGRSVVYCDPTIPGGIKFGEQVRHVTLHLLHLVRALVHRRITRGLQVRLDEENLTVVAGLPIQAIRVECRQ